MVLTGVRGRRKKWEQAQTTGASTVLSREAQLSGGGDDLRKCVNRRLSVPADDWSIKVLRISESESRGGLPQIHALIPGVSTTLLSCRFVNTRNSQ
jgi:hypothetical protein